MHAHTITLQVYIYYNFTQNKKSKSNHPPKGTAITADTAHRRHCHSWTACTHHATSSSTVRHPLASSHRTKAHNFFSPQDSFYSPATVNSFYSTYRTLCNNFCSACQLPCATRYVWNSTYTLHALLLRFSKIIINTWFFNHYMF